MHLRNMPISLIDALNQTEDKSRTFQIKWVTLNKEKRTGGQVIELTRAVRMGAKYKLSGQDMIVVKQKGSGSHPYPVHIHLITEFNNQPVFI